MNYNELCGGLYIIQQIYILLCQVRRFKMGGIILLYDNPRKGRFFILGFIEV